MPENTAVKDEEQTQKFIDVEAAIASKSPTLARFLPGFLLRYIIRTVHQDELNDAVYRNRHRQGHDFVDAAMEEFGVKVKTIGAENIPSHGGVILAANHPLGGLDGIAFMDVVGEYRKDIRFFVNDLLMALRNFDPIFVPVNKHGRNPSEYMARFEEVYASDACLLIFPAGLVSRQKKGGVIEDLVWKKSFVTKAIQYQKDIVPVFIEGKNSNFFYRLARFREMIGIKANVEMFYLPNEMYKQRGKTLTFTFGEPISWKLFTKDKSAEYWAERLKRHTYALHSGNKKDLITNIKPDQD
jgi:putative hemolysin